MIFDELWRKQWQRDRLQRLYDRDVKRALKRNDYKAAESIREEAAHFLNEADEGLQFSNSQRLIDRARRLPIPLPDYNDAQSWDNSWGRRVLTRKGQADLLREIRKEETERLEHRMRWVKIVLIPIGTFLIGVVSTYFAMKRNSGQQSSKAQTEIRQDQKGNHPSSK